MITVTKSKAMQEIDAIVAQLTDAVKELVQAIERKPLTTKDHYGDYLGAIGMITAKTGQATEGMTLAVGLAMIRAGANRNGVQAALKILGVL